jgi:hypothetical protein
VAWLVALAPRPAGADEITCGLVEKDVVQIDGLLDDWRGVAGSRFAGSNMKDLAATVRCNYGADTLFVSIDVVDDQLIRRKKGDKGAEDTLVLRLGPAGREAVVEVVPGDADQNLAARVKAPKGTAVADSLQPKGWSVEIGLPRGRVPAWGKGVTSLALGLAVRDADLFSEKQAQETLTLPPESRLVLEEGASLYQQFLADQGLGPKDIWLDQMANMDGEPGDERVVVGGRTIGVLGEQYYFMVLPVMKKDVRKLELVDLAGEGKKALLAHYVERGNGGSREVLAVWSLLPDGAWARPFAHEVAKESPIGKITSTWTLEPRKGGKGKKAKAGGNGLDLVIRVGETRGFSAATWNETPAADMAPMLLPWSDVKEERWRFQGDESFMVPN